VVRYRACLAALFVATTAAACSSSGGKGQTATTPPPPSSTSAGTSSAQAGALANTMRKGMSGLTSAHIAVDAGTLGGKSDGVVKYADGQATASDITLDMAGRTRVVTIGNTTYAKLPAGQNTTGKPWALVSPNSSNEFVRGLAGQLTITRATSSLPAVADVVATATSVQNKGGGHYALQLDPSRSAGTTLGSVLSSLGEKTVPVQLTLDGKGRPVLIQISVKLGSQSFPVVIKVSNFNQPVTITAPPRDQVIH
jgi:hypothetical protein